MWESFLEWISDTKLLLVIPEFAVFLLSTFVLYIFFDIPYVNFPEYAVENHNITETDASYLVSGIGLTNMVSMLFCGFIADWGQTRQVRVGCNLSVCGCRSLACSPAGYGLFNSSVLGCQPKTRKYWS